VVQEDEFPRGRETMPGHRANAGHVLDNFVEERKPGCRWGCRRRRTLSRREIRRHHLLLRVHELLHGAQVLDHHLASRQSLGRDGGRGFH
jgi:hypothetical protein